MKEGALLWYPKKPNAKETVMTEVHKGNVTLKNPKDRFTLYLESL